MANEIYRRAALERLGAADHQGATLRLVGTPGWLVVGGFALAVLFGLVWMTRVEAPVKAQGQGILMSGGGLVEIVTDREGLLESLDLAPGDTVRAGQVVGRLSRAELRLELAAAEAKLVDARERYARLEQFYAEQTQRQALADAERNKSIAQTRRVLQDRMKLLDERVQAVTLLLERKVVLRDRLIEAEVAASNERERLAALDEEQLRLQLDAIEQQSQQRLALLDEKLATEDLEREVERLREGLAAQQVVRSSHDGRVAEVKVNLGDVVQPGTPLATLAPAGEEDLVGVLYVPPAEGKRIQPGMAAEVEPTTVEREVYGHILAEVVSVAPLPATAEGMRRSLQNDRLVAQLSEAGAPIEVRVRLRRDERAPTRLAWSSSEGPDGGVNGGTLIDGRIVVERVPLIDLVLPGATKKLAVLD